MALVWMRSLMVWGRTRRVSIIIVPQAQTNCLGSFDSNFKMLKRKGTLVSVGNASGAVPPFAPIRLVEKNLKLLRPT